MKLTPPEAQVEVTIKEHNVINLIISILVILSVIMSSCCDLQLAWGVAQCG